LHPEDEFLASAMIFPGIVALVPDGAGGA